MRNFLVLKSLKLQYNLLTLMVYLQQAKVGKEELVKETKYPKREEFQWRPSPILCKRFDLTDPYMGKVSFFYIYNKNNN